jgi:hypothetical protein
MSEILKPTFNLDQSAISNSIGTETVQSLGEFDPLVHPELALQTYEKFGGDNNRAAQVGAFTDGATYHLEMTYPKLSTAEARSARATLQSLYLQAIAKYGDDSLTASSIKYRLQETEFLEIAARMNEQAANGTDKEVLQSTATEYVQLTEQLYGKPDKEVVDSMLYDLLARYGATGDQRIDGLWKELQEGFNFTLENGEEVHVPALRIPAEGKALPELTDKASELLEKEWKLAFVAATEARGLIADVIAVQENIGSEYDAQQVAFDGLKTAAAFRVASASLAAHYQTPQFNVEENPNSTTASWESGRQAVVVGISDKAGGRSYGGLRKVLVHESMHGLKSSNGMKASEPSLATGVFAENTDGSFIDYLTFEEGNNKLGEQVVDSERSDKKLENSYNLYLLAGLVYEGYDDRQVAAVMTKLNTIERLALNPELDQRKTESDLNMKVAKRVERLFRGTPAAAELDVDGHRPIFTKDIAYYQGTKSASEYWNEIAKDAEMAGIRSYVIELALSGSKERAEHARTVAERELFHEEFMIQLQGKIDPTDPRQYRVAKAAYEKTRSTR